MSCGSVEISKIWSNGSGIEQKTGGKRIVPGSDKVSASDINEIRQEVEAMLTPTPAIGISTRKERREALGIYTGRVSSGGVGSEMPLGWSSVRTAKGAYTIYHTAAGEAYNVNTTPYYGGTTHINYRGPDHFTIYCREHNNGSSQVDSGFDFTVVMI